MSGQGPHGQVAVVDGEALGHVRPWLEVRRRQGINGRAPIVNTVADGAKRAGVCTSGQPLDSS